MGSFPSTAEAKKHMALRFGKSAADYIIEWSPNMGAFTRQFSVCTWLRRVYQSSHSTVLHYYNDGYGMRFISNGWYKFANVQCAWWRMAS